MSNFEILSVVGFCFSYSKTALWKEFPLKNNQSTADNKNVSSHAWITDADLLSVLHRIKLF